MIYTSLDEVKKLCDSNPFIRIAKIHPAYRISSHEFHDLAERAQRELHAEVQWWKALMLYCYFEAADIVLVQWCKGLLLGL